MKDMHFLKHLGKRQRESIEAVLAAIIKEYSVEAVYLKGSIARNQSDEYSDVDFYCLINSNFYAEFLNKRISLLESYRPLIYYSEANFVCPQIVAVYDNGLHFDLYSEKSLNNNKDMIKVIYDPKGKLSNYESSYTSNLNELVAQKVNSFSFTLLEFEAAYKRKDYLWATRLGHHLVGDMSAVLSYLYAKNKQYLGLKQLYKQLDPIVLLKFMEIVELIKPSTILFGIIELTNFLEEQLNLLEKEVLDNINIEFFSFMSNKIKSIETKR